MRFLIVDDDESIQMYLERTLAPYAPCDCALRGEEGIVLFRKALEEGRPYDVVFMDILMPGMNGHEAAIALREVEKAHGVGETDRFKLVMVTSLVDDTNVSKAFFEAHASCYIVKPLDKDRVIEELKQNLVL